MRSRSVAFVAFSNGKPISTFPENAPVLKMLQLRPRVLKMPQPDQHLVGSHDITELLDDVFQGAAMLVVR